MATLIENAAAVKAASQAIDAAIVAKGGTTAGGLTNAAAAIAALPSWGWNKPELWPNLREIVDQSLIDHPEYTNACGVLLMDFSDSIDFNKSTPILTSDGAFYLENASHTWDRSEDIEIEDGAKCRWYVAFSSASDISWDVVRYDQNSLMWICASNGTVLVLQNSIPRSYFLQSIDAEIRKTSTIHDAINRCFSLKNVTEKITISRSAQGLLGGCNSLSNVPAVIDMTGCTNASYMFQGCSSLTSVPDVLDLSACTTTGNMFQGCSSLTSVPDVLDLSACTTTGNMFESCYSLTSVPDVLDLSACTYTVNMFANCFKLLKLPTHVTAIRGLSFAQSNRVSKDSVATFDANGVVNGGFVGNLNTKPSDAGTQTMVFHDGTKALFTADEWEAVKTCLTDKGWSVSPA